jgi:hypothetical protein
VNTINDLKTIKFIYTSLSVIELVIQKRFGILNENEYFPEYFEYYGNEDYCQNIVNLFNIFDKIDTSILIHMLWWLTFIINTGWFYADLEENYVDVNSEKDYTNFLYQQLEYIEGILNNKNEDLLKTFFDGVLTQNFNDWLEIWYQTILELEKGQIQPNLYLEILDSHYSNLFQFFQGEPEDNVQTIIDGSKDDFGKIGEIYNEIIATSNKDKGFGFQYQPVIQPPERQYTGRQYTGRQYTGRQFPGQPETAWRNKYGNIDNSDDENTPQEYFNNMEEGGGSRGKISKKEKAIKKNKKKYSIKKKYKNAIKRNKRRYSIKKKHNKTKKRNRHKQKRKNTKKKY